MKQVELQKKYQITNLKIPDCFLIKPTVFQDQRGIFIKTFQHSLFEQLQIDFTLKEFFFTTSRQDVIRGLHFQLPPFAQAKIVGCMAGKILDVIVDLRTDSPTFGQFELIALDSADFQMLYIPAGCAHGFLTLSEQSTLIYFLSEEYAPEHDTGILWNSLDIPWPITNPMLSDRDQLFVEFKKFQSPFRLRYPQVSVCIPVYNGAKTIANTIQSVLKQTLPNFELIIVDNASTDDTVKIVQQFSDPRIKLVQNSENIGSEANWNKAMKLCAAPLVKLLCADDVIYPECLQKQAAILAREDCQDVALVACKRAIITTAQRVLLAARGLSGMRGKYTRTQMLTKIFKSASNPIGEPAAVMFRNNAEVFDASIPYFIDLDFWCKLLDHGCLYAQDEVLAAFCVSRGSWSKQLGKQQSRQARQFFRALREKNSGSIGWLQYFITITKAAVLAKLRQGIYFLLRFSQANLFSRKQHDAL